MDWNRELFVLHLIEAAALSDAGSPQQRASRGCDGEDFVFPSNRRADVYDADGVLLLLLQLCCDFTRKKGSNGTNKMCALYCIIANE